MNTTKDRTFELTTPRTVKQAPDLVTRKSMNLDAPLKIGPRSTVVLFFEPTSR